MDKAHFWFIVPPRANTLWHEGAKPWIGETLYWPHRHCRDYGKPFAQGYVVKNGTSRGQPQAWRTTCETRVVLRYGTAYNGLEADPVILETAVRALVEGHALRDYTQHPSGIEWRATVALSCCPYWHALPMSACQLDELWSCVPTKEAHLSGAKL
jgi:hypothetical protein